MTLTSAVNVTVGAQQSTPLDLGVASFPLSKQYAVSLASGVLAGQADRLFTDTRTLAASTTEDLDLAGVLVDALGATCSFARVKALIVAAAAANTNNVLVGGAAANGFITPFGGATHQAVVRPGGVLAVVCGLADLTGYVVIAGTGDLLRIGNSGAGSGVTYDIVIIGASA